MKTITHPTTAEERIGHELRSLGFVEGAPSHIAPDLVDADIRIYRRMACPNCKRRGMRVQPLHRGREYRLLCACKHGCGGEVEA